MDVIYMTQGERDGLDPADVRAVEAEGGRIVVVGDVEEANRRSIEDMFGRSDEDREMQNASAGSLAVASSVDRTEEMIGLLREQNELLRQLVDRKPGIPSVRRANRNQWSPAMRVRVLNLERPDAL
jgi:hypothetical protein